MEVLAAKSENIGKVVEYLKQGGVVIHATDTCYGLAADITNQKAVKKVCVLKKMSLEKPMSILVGDLVMLKKYARIDNLAGNLIKKYLPGSLTLILLKTVELPNFYAKGNDFVGVRYPQHSLSLELVSKLGNPITTTSANLTGKMQAYTSLEVQKYFENEDVLFLDSGNLEIKKPSTILKCIDGFCEIIRQGDLLIEDFCENIT